ncbi:PEP-CTERM sorting domain-containing protein [Dapis sp. BLCC M229]|uniref:PEP-CTERM sorting domain-containing protein n=1 Tax=Dapis sp. BLCC M229 TaxID=3400188 RepID=UPI003CEB907A
MNKNIISRLRNWASTSAALLASASIVFAPPAAEAFTLIKNDDGAVVEILDLEVSGELFDVEFRHDSYDNIYNGTFDFETIESATEAAEAIAEALGDTEFTMLNSRVGDTEFFRERSDSFLIPFNLQKITPTFTIVESVSDSYATRATDVVSQLGVVSFVRYQLNPYAKFERLEEAPLTEVPEPSLIFGFITLSGLMLGSKRKGKG